MKENAFTYKIPPYKTPISFPLFSPYFLFIGLSLVFFLNVVAIPPSYEIDRDDPTESCGRKVVRWISPIATGAMLGGSALSFEKDDIGSYFYVGGSTLFFVSFLGSAYSKKVTKGVRLLPPEEAPQKTSQRKSLFVDITLLTGSGFLLTASLMEFDISFIANDLFVLGAGIFVSDAFFSLTEKTCCKKTCQPTSRTLINSNIEEEETLAQGNDKPHRSSAHNILHVLGTLSYLGGSALLFDTTEISSYLFLGGSLLFCASAIFNCCYSK